MKRSLWGLCAVCVTSLLLTACGGNDDGYGSVAVSDSTRRVGISSGELTQSIANDEARDDCDASDCRVVLQFEQCGAVSAGTKAGGGFVVVAKGAGTAFDAQTAANNACTAQGGEGCGPIPNLEAQCN
ncbi:DUF4189 domain-containing protein [Hydrogenophaga aromaticivorans]|uniref:DUF4189 domain-containing protein n=1 Tax=Hydrogenophaga aromaticivorans TaxID=2610898 RepID=UPI001B361CB9|nr:DUF4189 domain-containing protein [Hydrogenophaga aromaticivorans]MBQ0917319.1 DUF4189 domain-containing protein [Hydrogenophaga aromaticivorans]